MFRKKSGGTDPFTSKAASGSNAIALTDGQRVSLGTGFAYLFSDGSQIVIAGDALQAKQNGTGDVIAGRVRTGIAGALTVQGGPLNNASAIAVVTNSDGALTAVGSKLHSFQNATVEKAYVDKDGLVNAPEFRVGNQKRIFTSGANLSMQYESGFVFNVTDGGGLHGVQFNSSGIEVTTIGEGFILKSPDGTRYRITVANGGALSTTPA